MLANNVSVLERIAFLSAQTRAECTETDNVSPSVLFHALEKESELIDLVSEHARGKIPQTKTALAMTLRLIQEDQLKLFKNNPKPVSRSSLRMLNGSDLPPVQMSMSPAALVGILPPLFDANKSHGRFFDAAFSSVRKVSSSVAIASGPNIQHREIHQRPNPNHSVRQTSIAEPAINHSTSKRPPSAQSQPTHANPPVKQSHRNPTKSIATMTEPKLTREMGTQTDVIQTTEPSSTYRQAPRRESEIVRTNSKRDLTQSLQRANPESDYEDERDDSPPKKQPTFVTALDKKIVDDKAKGIHRSNDPTRAKPALSKPSGLNRSNGKFKPPFKVEEPQEPIAVGGKKDAKPNADATDERFKNIDPAMIEAVRNEIMDNSKGITWDDIAGLQHAKNTIQEAVIWPMSRPDIFNGLRAPPKGLLLFGPPGTGKTLIGKCIAGQSGATFFNISSSSLTSKWVGDGEKMVRALFAVARVEQPSVIFIDEIDSLLTQRTDGENEASRRIKTEFLVQFDGCGTSSEDRILLIGEIDEAARRRFRKKLYIPLPEAEARMSLMNRLLLKQKNSLSPQEIEYIVAKTDGYSGSDIDGLVREAALGPIRRLGSNIMSVSVNDVSPVNVQDFNDALTQVRASVSEKDLEFYLKFDADFGSLSGGRA
ncbi:Fidgetin-like protein 1 [Chytriomyces hyalinus]|nr:Fidgetin-like protein 1 [Chytriomyces hyalinus]